MKENGKNLTDLTLEEVFKLQKDILKNKDNKFDSSAVGKYQIVSNTLFGKGGTPQYPTPNSLMRQLNLKPTDKFDEETQDKMAIQLMKGRGLNKFLSGRMTEEQFISNLSKEWESLPENMANVSGLTKGKRSLVGYEQIASAVSGLKLNNASATTQQMRAELASTQAPVVVPVPTTSPQQGQRPTQTTPIASAFNENAAELFLDNAIDIAG